MITNNNLVFEYGRSNIFLKSYNTPVPYKPIPASGDFSRGYIERYIAIRNSDKSGCEINSNTIENIDDRVYTVYQILWRITGKKDFTKVGNIIEDYGVQNQNLQQIEKVKINSKVSLTPFLKNPLEFWRGY